MGTPSEFIWFGAKTVYINDVFSAEQGVPCYEERIVVLRACSLDHAIESAEEEAEEYASWISGKRYLGYVNVFHMFEESLESGAEVYSIMRSIDLSEDEYLERFYNDGTFHTQ